MDDPTQLREGAATGAMAHLAELAQRVSCAEAGEREAAVQDLLSAVSAAARREAENGADYRRLVEMSPDPIAVHVDQRLVYVNPAAVRAVGGSSASDLLGRRLDELVDEEAMRQVPQRLAEMLRTGGPAPVMRGRFRRLDGTELVGDIASAPTTFNGRTAFQVVIRDTTQQTAAEEALRRREQEFEALVEDAPDVIARFDREHRITYINRAVERYTGRAPAEIVGRRLRRTFTPQVMARLTSALDQVFSTARPVSIELRLDSSVGPGLFECRILPQFGRDADVESALAVGRDITELRRTELALRRSEATLRASEARFRSLIEHSADLIAILDPDGRVLYQSPSVLPMLGYAPEDVLGRDIVELMHPDDAPAIRRKLARLCAAPDSLASAEFRMRHADGSWRALHVTAQNRLSDPAVRGIVANTRDLTMARELEAQLLQSQKMEAVGRLAGGMAHDFNNILTAVQGHASLLALELPPDSPQRADVREIQHSVERAASLTRQLLAFSRHQVLQPKVLDLNAIVRETGNMLRPLIGEDLDLRIELDERLGRIRADPAQVQQILLNLAVNARDAMPDGGRLVIGTANAELDEEYVRGFSYAVVPGRYVLLSFADSGTGIEAGVLDHIFEPFFTTKPPGSGTGLGLSSVYGTVKQSGGYIWVDTEVGQGTTFRIFLPRVEEVPESLDEPGSPLPAGAGVVLLVEDEPAVRSLALRVLSRAGYTVLPAANGEEALQLTQAHAEPIDLVLTDVIMPGLGGGELAARVKARHPRVRVLFMSGYAQDALARQGVADGAGFLAKPFSPDVLRHSVARALSGKGAD